MTLSNFIRLACLLTAIALASCGRAPTAGPPKILYGQDVCSHCGMIISEERFAAATVDPANPDNRPLLFDDIGCLLAYRKEHTPMPSEICYVHDFKSHQWIRNTQACFIHSENVETPMGSGFLAFGNPADAQRALQSSSQKPRSFSELLVPDHSQNLDSNSLSTR